MRKFLSKNGGYSLVELVVALALIILISAVWLSVIYSSIHAPNNASSKAEAQSFCENVWEAFKASHDDTQFVQNVTFANGINLEEIDVQDGYTYYVYAKQERYVVEIKVKFDDKPTIDVLAKDKHGREILAFEFVKGGA